MQYNADKEVQSLYIHWPFCPYKCHFCPFVAFAGQDHLMTSYHEALVNEIACFMDGYGGKKIALETVYFGGGTPSTYPNELLLDMFGILKKYGTFSSSAEITLEVNPGTVTEEKLQMWKQVGINRLSIGVQSLDDAVLKKLNRHQTQQDVQWLLNRAHPLFANISVDVIIGLPGVSAQAWKRMLERLVQWPVTHVSMYFLMVHEHTPLYYSVQQKKVSLPADDATVDLYEWSVAFLKEHGFGQYEVSSFAQDGFQSKHNTVYWDRKPYKGFGVGACSFDGSRRFQNQKNLMSYIRASMQGNEEYCFSESLDKQQVRLEKTMLGLRRSEGIVCDDLYDGLSENECAKVQEQVHILKTMSLVEEKEGRLRLTTAALAVENEVVVKLLL